MPRPHYSGGIWKRRFHSENALSVFHPHYTGEMWLGKRNNNQVISRCARVMLGLENRELKQTTTATAASENVAKQKV